MKTHQFIQDNIEVIKKMMDNGINPRVALDQIKARQEFDRISTEGSNKKFMDIYDEISKTTFKEKYSSSTIRSWLFKLNKKIVILD